MDANNNSPRQFRVRLNVERILRSLSAADQEEYTTADVVDLLTLSGASPAADGWWLMPESAFSVVKPAEVEEILEAVPA